MQDKEAQAKAIAKIDAQFAERERELQTRALTAMLASEDGRALLWWLLQIGKWGTQPFTGNDSATNFNCGEMNVGQQIFARIIETEPSGFLRMQQERIDAERERTAAINRTGGEASDDVDW